jgi:N-carbamoyl-L-amino-acid hydrolase
MVTAMLLYPINSARLNRSLEELGRFGETPYGMDRLAFSSADIASRAFAMDLMRKAGLETRIDTAGNIIGRKAGSEDSLPAIALGSHTDTVPYGGKYDGALGVMGAIEVVQTLADRGHATRHPVEVIVFTNEEGTRYHRWLIGSRAMAGLLEQEDLDAVDDEGVSLSSRMADVGGDLSRVEEAARRTGDLAAYLELHIEQGPNLHRSGTPLGVVTGITGRAVFEVDIEGATNHAGTTPMADRHDALVSASKLVLDIRKMAAEDEICRVTTVGSILATPNAVNVIPGSAKLGLEFRDVDMQAMAAAEKELNRAAQRTAASDGVEITVNRHRFNPSVPIDSGMQSLVAEAAGRCGLAWEALPSGAGHDAQAIASIAPMAMLFVPSVDGISHALAEYSTPEDCANGTQALLELLLMADDRI